MSEEATLDEFVEESEKTEVSNPTIPDGWRVTRADEIMEITRGASPRPKGDPELFGGDIPWVKIGDVDVKNARYTGEAEDTVTEKGAKKSKLVDEGTLLVSNSGTCGYPMFAGRQSCVHDGWLILRDYEDSLNPYYLYEYINWKQNYLKSLAPGSTQINLNTSRFGVLEINTPPLPEQRNIATVLYTIDRAIEKTTNIISKREKVKNGIIQDIFRYGVDSDGQLRSTGDNTYQETKYGSAPKGWEVLPLEDIVADDASITYGIVKPGDHYPGGVPVVKVENITNGEVQTGDLLHTDPEIHEKYDRAELNEGDLLFTIRGTVGRMGFVPAELEGGNLTQDTARIRVDGANPEFIRYYLESSTPHNYFQRHTKGQAVQGINLEDLQKVPVHLPSREEQNRIVKILDSHTEQIQKEREYHDQLIRLKRGLQQDLLSGTVRTTDTNIEVPDEIAQYG